MTGLVMFFSYCRGCLIRCPYCTASGAGPGKPLCILCSKCHGEGMVKL